MAADRFRTLASTRVRISHADSNEKDRSCGGDVEEEVVVELDTTNESKFSVLQKV